MTDRYIIEAKHEDSDWFQYVLDTPATMPEAAERLWECYRGTGAPQCRVTYLCADTGLFRDMTEDVLWLAMQDDPDLPLFEATAFDLGLFDRMEAAE